MNGKPKKRNHFLSFIAAVLLIILFCTILLSSALVLYATKEIDAELDLALLIDEQGRTTKLYCFNELGEAVELEDQRLHGAENRIWVGLDSIPQNVQNAFIAIEDHRFYEHHGVDIRRTAGAVLSFLSPGSGDYGGSTITQQLIKNLTGDNSVTVKRKVTEIMRALELEKKISKDKILEIYLNTVYLSEGCYGLETAAGKYFGKSAAELSLVEGAALAAIIQYPTRYDPIQNPEYNRERRDLILWRMYELGMIEEAEYKEAIETDTELHLNEAQKTEGKNSWFTETVIEDVIADLSEKYGLTRTAASRMIYNGGLSIYTTMDAKMQQAVEEFYADENNFPKNTSGMRATSAAAATRRTAAAMMISFFFPFTGALFCLRSFFLRIADRHTVPRLDNIAEPALLSVDLQAHRPVQMVQIQTGKLQQVHHVIGQAVALAGQGQRLALL